MDLDVSQSRQRKNISNACKGVRNCSVELSASFVTTTQTAHVINGVLDHVLLFTGQIPFVFPVFK